MESTEKKINLSDFFKDDALTLIRTYVNNLQTYIKEYDLIIFMARKAICFFDALVKNGEISLEHSRCRITTNRIFTYNINNIIEKKIVVVDDIVVEGKTLRDTKDALDLFTKGFDIYYLAHEANNPNLIDIISDSRLLTMPVEFNRKDILTFSNNISNYITASMCSLNIDYPVFTASLSCDEFEDMQTKLSNYRISNSIQEYFDLDVNVQSIIGDKDTKLFNVIDCDDVVMKIRFFYDGLRTQNNLMMIPIVLFEKLSLNAVDKVYSICSDADIEHMISNKDYIYENKFKWIQYVLSYRLFAELVKATRFINSENYQFEISKQYWIFPREYDVSINKLINKAYVFPKVIIDQPRFNTFAIAEVYNRFHDYLMAIHDDAKNHRDTEVVYEDVLNYCQSKNIEFSLYSKILSIIFDVAIDKGLIVPFVKVQNSLVYRAYRLSEQYELTVKQQSYFIKMLSYYAHYNDIHEMDKILVEKLLVLFFNYVIKKEATEVCDSNRDNLFSVHYTRFGPVVSTGEIPYDVSPGAELTDKITSSAHLYEYKKLRLNFITKKYEIPLLSEFKVSDDWEEKASFFGEEYDSLNRIFCRITSNGSDSTRFSKVYSQIVGEQKRIDTFNKFITLKAIGSKIEDRYLSLLAELQLFLKNYEEDKSLVNSLFYSISGLRSGAWKYLCYKENSYSNMEQVIRHYFHFVREECAEVDVKIEKIRNELDRYRKQSMTSTPELSVFQRSMSLQNDLEKLRGKKAELDSIMHRESLCNRALPSSIDNESEYAKNVIENNMDKVAEIICKLLQCWGKVRKVYSTEYNEFKNRLALSEFGRELLEKVNPDRDDSIDILDLKKYIENENLIGDNDDVNIEIPILIKQTKMLISEYDVCFKKKLTRTLTPQVVVAHKLNEKKFNDGLLEKNDARLVKYCGVDINDGSTCIYGFNNDFVNTCVELMKTKDDTILIFDMNKKYNQCWLNSHGDGLQNEFIRIFQRTYNALKDSGGIYYICDKELTDCEVIMQDDDVNVFSIDSEKLKTLQAVEPVKNAKIALYDEYKDASIGIITALEKEYIAIKTLLKNIKLCDIKNKGLNAGCRYYIGEIDSVYKGTHKIIFTVLPGMGNDYAAIIATKMHEYFPAIKDIIMCGIAGGIPTRSRLGDIVVSKSGVVEYDFGTDTPTKFKPKEYPLQCSRFLSEAIIHLNANSIQNKPWIDNIKQIIQLNNDYIRPLQESPHYEKTKSGKYVKKVYEVTKEPQVRLGLIASGNAVKRNHINRDKLADEFNDLLAIEMESGGIGHATDAGAIKFLAIRGVCDYSDDLKDKTWQPYAAAVAAAYSCALIASIPVQTD